ncbi:MAG: four helix bundle protein, partial [Deltaproteobacteria bacterium]|nr:four helix bundle protein [Deltaproteobacteria bacterium]
MGYQIIRSSDSISVNIAEGVNFRLSFRGYGRYTPADRKKFYLYSRGSHEETKSWLRKLIRIKVLSESNETEYKAIVEK